jgi:hypothetical protein
MLPPGRHGRPFKKAAEWPQHSTSLLAAYSRGDQAETRFEGRDERLEAAKAVLARTDGEDE